MNERRSRWWVLTALAMSALVTGLSTSVVNTLLPVIARFFAAEVATVEWVVTLYLLVVSGLLLAFGRLGDLLGHRRIYLSGVALFTAGMGLSGLAPSIAALILFRALQGVGAAMLFATAPAILTRAFPPSQRGQALGLNALATYLGLVAGPSMGGWLATAYGWRSVFYANVPLGLLALLLGARFVPAEGGRREGETFDALGAGLFTTGLVALLLGLNRGSVWGWGAPQTWGLLALAALLLTAFVVVERRRAAPLLDLALFRIRLFSAATLSATLNYLCVYGILFLMPFYLIDGRGLTPARAGAILTAQPIVMALAAPVTGAISDRVGSRLLSTLGMGLLALSLFLYARLGATTPLPQVAAVMALSGLGVGLFTTPNTSALMGAAPPHRKGIASAVVATARNLGMALGVGVTGAVFNTVRASASLFEGATASFLVLVGVALAGMVASVTRSSSDDAVA